MSTRRDARDVSQSAARARLRDRDRLPGVHVDVSENGPARLRHHPHPLRPRSLCLELKALKYYLLEYRNQGIFYEAATNQILDDLVAACQPRRMTVIGDFTARGGITTKVTAEYVEG